MNCLWYTWFGFLTGCAVAGLWLAADHPHRSLAAGAGWPWWPSCSVRWGAASFPAWSRQPTSTVTSPASCPTSCLPTRGHSSAHGWSQPCSHPTVAPPQSQKKTLLPPFRHRSVLRWTHVKLSISFTPTSVFLSEEEAGVQEVEEGEREHAQALIMACRHLPRQMSSPGHVTSMLSKAAQSYTRLNDRKGLQDCHNMMVKFQQNNTPDVAQPIPVHWLASTCSHVLSLLLYTRLSSLWGILFFLYT